MYDKKIKAIKWTKTQITRNCDSFGKSIEEEIRQAVASKQPIETASPEIYTPLKDGVMPQYDPRTDRQEIALDALDKFSKSEILHRDELEKEPEKPKEESPNNEPPKNE